MRYAKRRARAFALYEVLLGLAIFSVGVLVLGRSVQNCLNASTLSSEQERVRQILSNRMAEIQAAPVVPDESKRTIIDTGYGEVTLIQRSEPAGLKDENDLEMSAIKRVTLTVEWRRGGQAQSKKIEFYVYRLG
jgi:type II secretory pathway pseudopilin PulG